MHFESLTRNVVPLTSQRLRAKLASLPAPVQDPCVVSLRVGISSEDGQLTHILHAQGFIEAILVFETLRDSGYMPVVMPGMDGRVHRVYGAPRD